MPIFGHALPSKHDGVPNLPSFGMRRSIMSLFITVTQWVVEKDAKLPKIESFSHFLYYFYIVPVDIQIMFLAAVSMNYIYTEHNYGGM